MDRRTFIKDAGKAVGTLSLLGAVQAIAAPVQPRLRGMSDEYLAIIPPPARTAGQRYTSGPISAWIGGSHDPDIALVSCDEASLYLQYGRQGVKYIGKATALFAMFGFSAETPSLDMHIWEPPHDMSAERLVAALDYGTSSQQVQQLKAGPKLLVVPTMICGKPVDRDNSMLLTMESPVLGKNAVPHTPYDDETEIGGLAFHGPVKLYTPMRRQEHPAWLAELCPDNVPAMRQLSYGGDPTLEQLTAAAVEFYDITGMQPHIHLTASQWAWCVGDGILYRTGAGRDLGLQRDAAKGRCGYLIMEHDGQRQMIIVSGGHKEFGVTVEPGYDLRHSV